MSSQPIQPVQVASPVSQRASAFRKLSRELVIFILVSALFAAAFGFVSERHRILEAKPSVTITLDEPTKSDVFDQIQPTSTSQQKPVTLDFSAGIIPLWQSNIKPTSTAQKILLATNATDDNKTNAWRAYFDSKNERELDTRLRTIDIPPSAKAALVKAKGPDANGWFEYQEPAVTGALGDQTKGVPNAKPSAHQAAVPSPTVPLNSIDYQSCAWSALVTSWLGAIGGVILWVLYRLVRFAIVG
jgi:hypothetical protein